MKEQATYRRYFLAHRLTKGPYLEYISKTFILSIRKGAITQQKYRPSV